MPAWLPDSNSLVFVRYRDPNSIWLADRRTLQSARQVWPPQ
jgi:hypothetical protein